jgi:hypothetical protein
MEKDGSIKSIQKCQENDDFLQYCSQTYAMYRPKLLRRFIVVVGVIVCQIEPVYAQLSIQQVKETGRTVSTITWPLRAIMAHLTILRPPRASFLAEILSTFAIIFDPVMIVVGTLCLAWETQHQRNRQQVQNVSKVLMTAALTGRLETPATVNGRRVLERMSCDDFATMINAARIAGNPIGTNREPPKFQGTGRRRAMIILIATLISAVTTIFTLPDIVVGTAAAYAAHTLLILFIRIGIMVYYKLETEVINVLQAGLNGPVHDYLPTNPRDVTLCEAQFAMVRDVHKTQAFSAIRQGCALVNLLVAGSLWVITWTAGKHYAYAFPFAVYITSVQPLCALLLDTVVAGMEPWMTITLCFSCMMLVSGIKLYALGQFMLCADSHIDSEKPWLFANVTLYEVFYYCTPN